MAKKIPTKLPQDLFGVMLNGEWLTESAAARQFQTEPETDSEGWFLNSVDAAPAHPPAPSLSQPKTHSCRRKQTRQRAQPDQTTN